MFMQLEMLFLLDGITFSKLQNEAIDSLFD
jgi:hypothetical protein